MRTHEYKTWNKRLCCWDYSVLEFDADGKIQVPDYCVICEGAGFHDINGDPSRKLWEGDVLETRNGYRVIVFKEKYGQWFAESSQSGLGLYLVLDAYGAKYAGNVFENGNLVSWYIDMSLEK